MTRRAALGGMGAWVVTLACVAPPASAQARRAGAVGPAAPALEPGSATASDAALRVYLMTIGQGEAIWEHFGHNALVIEDPSEGTRVAWHWGLFDFDEPGFLLRFLRGEMRYWMAGFDAARLTAAYERQGRSVTLQELALSQAQALELRAFVQWNALPENRFYRYDYFVDNCSTRLRDALDRVLDGALAEQFASWPAGISYRHETERLTGRAVLDFLGITLLLGPRGDEPRSRWEQMFTPLNLQIWLRDARVAGTGTPLVRAERMVVAGTLPPPLTAPPPLTLPLLLVGVALGGAFVLLGRWAEAPGIARRLPLAFLGGLWSALAGLGGLILIGVYATRHVWMYGNENVLQLDPLSVAVAFALPWALLRGGTLRRTAWLVGVVAVVSAAGFAAQALPGVDQGNGVIIAAALPAHVGLALAVRRLARRRSEAERGQDREKGGGA